jgi:hypothetical protein
MVKYLRRILCTNHRDQISMQMHTKYGTIFLGIELCKKRWITVIISCRSEKRELVRDQWRQIFLFLLINNIKLICSLSCILSAYLNDRHQCRCGFHKCYSESNGAYCNTNLFNSFICYQILHFFVWFERKWGLEMRACFYIRNFLYYQIWRKEAEFRNEKESLAEWWGPYRCQVFIWLYSITKFSFESRCASRNHKGFGGAWLGKPSIIFPMFTVNFTLDQLILNSHYGHATQ